MEMLSTVDLEIQVLVNAQAEIVNHGDEMAMLSPGTIRLSIAQPDGNRTVIILDPAAAKTLGLNLSRAARIARRFRTAWLADAT